MNVAVWAPLAKSVELVTPQRRFALHREESGYWQNDVEAAALEHGYRYSIDGGEPLPDPRSQWQPDGVHGSSRVIDWSSPDAARARSGIAAFQATALGDAVIY